MTNSDIGLSHWLKQREEFTQNHIKYDPYSKGDSYKRSPILAEVEESHLDSIYQSIISGRKFQQTAPLSFVTRVLLYGWLKEGMVTSSWPANNKLI
jgi:hypothetical protein